MNWARWLQPRTVRRAARLRARRDPSSRSEPSFGTVVALRLQGGPRLTHRLGSTLGGVTFNCVEGAPGPVSSPGLDSKQLPDGLAYPRPKARRSATPRNPPALIRDIS